MPEPITLGVLGTVGMAILGFIGNGLQLFLQFPNVVKYVVLLGVGWGLTWHVAEGLPSIGDVIFIPFKASLEFFLGISTTYQDVLMLVTIVILVLFVITIQQTVNNFKSTGRIQFY